MSAYTYYVNMYLCVTSRYLLAIQKIIPNIYDMIVSNIYD